jgi:hypothetical protein
MVIAFAALALLVVAAVSSTQADIAAVIAVATLGAWLLGVGLFGWRRPWWDRTGFAAVTPLPAAARTRSDGR